MTFSPLTKRTIPLRAPNGYSTRYSSRNGAKVSRLIIHYTAGGSDESNEREMGNNPNRVASVNYVLRRDGSLSGVVPEEYRAWTSGGQAADGPSITVETVAPPNGNVTAAQVATLKKLAADLSKRYGWGPLTRTNVRGHREFQSTDCPGPVLWPMIPQIIADANKIRGGGSVETETAPDPAAVKKVETEVKKMQLVKVNNANTVCLLTPDGVMTVIPNPEYLGVVKKAIAGKLEGINQREFDLLKDMLRKVAASRKAA